MSSLLSSASVGAETTTGLIERNDLFVIIIIVLSLKEIACRSLAAFTLPLDLALALAQSLRLPLSLSLSLSLTLTLPLILGLEAHRKLVYCFSRLPRQARQALEDAQVG